jgi:hypothetical protein
MRFLIIGVIAIAACCSMSLADEADDRKAPAEGASLLTAAEAKDVDAVVAAMVKAGFPDGRMAVVYQGKVHVSATFDPSKGAPPLPSDASAMQETIPNSPLVTYGYVFEGLHLKLADGSWIISLSMHFVPKKDDTVNVDGAKAVDLSIVTADAISEHPFDAAKAGAKWLERVAPAQRERTAAAMTKFVPVLNALAIGQDALAPAVILLHRAGWADAAALSLVLADQRARNYWQMRAWTTPDPAFDPSGAYPQAKEEEEAWKKEHEKFTAEPPAIALRRAMFRWCRAQISIPDREEAMLPPDVAATACKAAVDPKDPQGYAKRVEALAAGAKLDVEPAEDADLPARLQSWEARPRQPKMTVTGGNQGGNPAIRTSFSAPPAAYTPNKSDLDALVALLSDERPSRFSDFSGPRTLGDNAWRAVTVLLKSDPRTLAKYPTDHPWTAAERKAAAAAVQKWWKAHRSEYVEK